MAGSIWILDDDADLGTLLLEQFGQRGWQARHLSHPRELEQALNETVPDLLVLMLSALGAPRDRIAGLEAEANDYLGKPFLFRELQLRVDDHGAGSPPTPTPSGAGTGDRGAVLPRSPGQSAHHQRGTNSPLNTEFVSHL